VSVGAQYMINRCILYLDDMLANGIDLRIVLPTVRVSYPTCIVERIDHSPNQVSWYLTVSILLPSREFPKRNLLLLSTDIPRSYIMISCVRRNVEWSTIDRTRPAGTTTGCVRSARFTSAVPSRPLSAAHALVICRPGVLSVPSERRPHSNCVDRIPKGTHS
jgi:hypothetical protein